MTMKRILVAHPTVLHLTSAIITKENYKYCHRSVDRVDRCWPYNAQSLAQTPATSCQVRGEGVSPNSSLINTVP
jgi:hypothetical protein